MTLTADLLKQENAQTSNAIIETLADHVLFKQLADYEGDMTLSRDNEDGQKLQKGIDIAKQKGVLDANLVPPKYTEIDVLGKTPEEVASIILNDVGLTKGKKNKGSVIVLCGLSGTGKGTTVSKLRQQLEESGKKVVTWSNGNIFRSVTLLAVTWSEQNGGAPNVLDTDKALTKDQLESYMQMLQFGQFNGNDYDIQIQGLGLELLVSNVATTTLKEPKVSKNIPTVAEVTQGEVVLFASQAVQQLSNAGYVVLLEGREQTVNYIPTPHRFTLTLSDASLIGKRRAAQRIMGAAANQKDLTDDTVMATLEKLLEDMTAEINAEKKGNTDWFCYKWFMGSGKK